MKNKVLFWLVIGALLWVSFGCQKGREAPQGDLSNLSVVEVRVKGVHYDPLSKQPIVVLVDLNQKSALPIWIGESEAKAIAFEMEEVVSPRPMTHDLIRNILVSLKAKVNRVVITELKGNTFYAILDLFCNGSKEIVDCRPSDAIAVALRTKSPIFVAKELMKEPLEEEPSQEGLTIM